MRNLVRFVRDQLGFLREMTDRHGDVVEMRMLGRPWILVNHPDDVERVLVKEHAKLERDEYASVLERALGKGLLTSDGELWKRQRRLAARAFTPKRIRGYGDRMVEVTAAGLDRWRDGEVIDLHAEMSRVTMEVVADALFGVGVSPRDVDTVRDSMEEINAFFANSPEALMRLPPRVPTPRNRRMSAAIAAIDALLFRIIEERRRDPEERDDLLGALLAARDDDGSAMDDAQLRDECVTLFLAGHETTALALAHVFFLLSKHPAVGRRMQAEIDGALGGRRARSDDAKALPYTRQVIEEAMRLYPPAWITGRAVAEPITLRGREIPVGAQLVVSQWIVHRDPRWWDDPEGFDPDRFAPGAAKERPRFAYFPFGGGPRVCIGNHFAMLEAILLTATIAQRYRLDLVPGERLEFDPSVTLRPVRHVRTRLVARAPLERPGDREAAE